MGREFDPAFAAEAKAFGRAVQLEIAALAGLLRQFGPQLRRPHCDTLKGSKHANMKELRFTLPDGEWRVAFFNPERCAILLVGGSKEGITNYGDTCIFICKIESFVLQGC